MPVQSPELSPPTVKPRRRWRRLALLALVLIVVGIPLAFRLYLATPHSSRMASDQLSEALGLPLYVASVSPGLGSTSVNQVEIGGDDAHTPWATVREVSGDVSLLGLLLGEMPRRLTLREAAVTLRFDRDGKLLTKLPKASTGGNGAVPAIHLENCQLTLLQDGHVDSVFAGIDGDVREENGAIHIEGTLSDKNWGHWKLASEVASKTRTGMATLKTVDAVKATPELLKRIPFVDKSVWEAVSLDGTTTADVRFDFNPDDFRYRVQASPRQTAVFVSSIDLKATDASGTVMVEESVVTLKGVQGKAADGTLDVDGVLDFRKRPSELKLTVKGRDLLVKDLPPDWDIEAKVPVKGIGGGRLSGEASLVISTGDGSTTTGGSGSATVIVPKFVSGQDLKVDLHLAPKGRRFEFGPKPGARESRLQPALQEQPDFARANPTPEQAEAWTPALAMLTLLQPTAIPKEAPKDSPYLDLDFALRDVDLAELLDKLEYAPPFKIAGRITVKVKASIPTDKTNDLKSYRLVGTADMPKFTIENLTLEDVKAKVVYRDGILTLTDFTGRMPEPGNPKAGGSFAGTAKLGVIPAGDLSANMDVKSLDLAELSRNVPALAELKLEGLAQGTVKASSPVAKPGAARQINADFDLTAPKLKVRNIPAEKLHATADYRESQWKYKIDAAALGGTIELEGSYPPKKMDAKPEPQGGRLIIRDARLAKLGPVLGVQGVFDSLEGLVQFDLPYHYDANGQAVGVGTLQLDRLSYNGREIAPRLQSLARLGGSELRFERIESALGIGSVRGLVIVNTANFDRSRVVLTLRSVPVEKLLFVAPEFAKRIDASFDAEIRTTIGRHIRGSAVFAASNGKFFGQRAGMLRIPVEWDFVPSQQRGTLTVHDLTGDLAQGHLAGKATYDYFGASGGRAEGEIRFQNVNVPSLNAAKADLGTYGVGRANGKFEFSGSEVRSIDDLKGLLVATLGETQLGEIPVLKEILPFLGPSARVADRRSEVRSTLNRGVWHVERLVLIGRNLQLIADGTVTTSGRLNLAVIANTGQLSVSPLALRAAGLTIPVMVGPVPVGLILELSRYISNRTVNLEVTGTIDQPNVRVNTAKLLRDEVIRFFLDQNNIPVP